MSVGLRAADVRSVDLVENLNPDRSPAVPRSWVPLPASWPVSSRVADTSGGVARSCVVFATVLSRSGGRANARGRGAAAMPIG